ncbi:peptidoglycan recognition protein family protein [Catenuloplanes atrovinosus]|uniref:Uncharacterized protein with LGFP repeats n=1 Tax=Catenuloplanes atrovinosus TaxID=137266 RepID=A0AAE3YN55_9ACTN|nr:N-acetylmuramoyl-L-alanine amidase [Catenuloplanes atrovinosus]MDR7276575.1 uncharacterized protein with LGFP repeats [Catenuloplanes atrovinosus]
MRGWVLPALTAVALGAGGVGVAVAGQTDPAVQRVELAAARDGGTVTLPARTVRPFSLIGVTWPDAAQSISGTAQVRTRTRHAWSQWRALDVDQHYGPDGDRAEATGMRGGTDPLWVGPADGVELRIRALGRSPLPSGMRLELVNPAVASAVPTPPSVVTATPVVPVPAPLVGAPAMVDRAAWRADERINRGGVVYTGAPQVMFVHHTAGTNDYTCAQSAALIRAIHVYHVKSRKWGDIGYNFVVDKCGTVYEGRRGGAELHVMGAHTFGFNTNSLGVVVLGTYGAKGASAAAIRSLAHLAAWKLGPEAADPAAQAILESRADNRYQPGNQVIFARVSGHRDGVQTECPGNALYRQIPQVRRQAAALIAKALAQRA